MSSSQASEYGGACSRLCVVFDGPCLCLKYGVEGIPVAALHGCGRLVQARGLSRERCSRGVFDVIESLPDTEEGVPREAVDVHRNARQVDGDDAVIRVGPFRAQVYAPMVQAHEGLERRHADLTVLRLPTACARSGANVR